MSRLLNYESNAANEPWRADYWLVTALSSQTCVLLDSKSKKLRQVIGKDALGKWQNVPTVSSGGSYRAFQVIESADFLLNRSSRHFGHGICSKTIKRPGPPAEPLTKSEFQKSEQKNLNLDPQKDEPGSSDRGSQDCKESESDKTEKRKVS